MWTADKKGSKTNQGEARQNVGEIEKAMAKTQNKCGAGKQWWWEKMCGATTKTQCKTPKRGKNVWGRCKKTQSKRANAKQKSERKANVRQCKNNKARKAMWAAASVRKAS